MEKYDIVIIDSGVDRKHLWLENLKIEGRTAKLCNNELVINEAIDDSEGHGTAVFYLIQSNAPSAAILNIRLCPEDRNIETICCILEYIHNAILCSVINLSCGIEQCADIDKLKSVCNNLTDSGVIIVAAYSNEGAMSYPACFDNVIGVDLSTSLSHPNSYYYIESQVINIRYAGFPIRVPWKCGTLEFMQGASFCAPRIAALVWKILQRATYEQKNFLFVLQELKRYAVQTIQPLTSQEVPQYHPIGKGIVYPFNKEIRSLLSFDHLLNWKIVGVYDNKYSRNIGKNMLGFSYSYSGHDFIVQNIEKIDWDDDFDTIVIGHSSKSELSLSDKITKRLIEKAFDKQKNVFMFDETYLDQRTKFIECGLNFYCPTITHKNIPNDRFGKQYYLSKPVIGVFGTSPRQGKMTVQMLLKHALSQMGYMVGHLGTEPSSMLLGCDAVYSMGYFSTVHLSRYEAIGYINEVMHNIELKNYDVIIIGSQSQTIARTPGNIGFYPLEQYELILGSWPDAFILLVNPDDDFDYIHDTISFLESSCHGKVISLTVFPGIHNIQGGNIIGEPIVLDQSVLEQKAYMLEKEFKVPVFVLNASVGEKLATLCINYFAE